MWIFVRCGNSTKMIELHYTQQDSFENGPFSNSTEVSTTFILSLASTASACAGLSSSFSRHQTDVMISWVRETEVRGHGPSVGAESECVSIQSAEPCHTVMEIIAWETGKLPSAYPTLYQSWLLSLVTIIQILTQKCQKIKHPTYFIVIKSFSRSLWT